MLTDLLAFLSSTIKGQDRRHHQINATKLKALIDDIQMRKRFIGFIGPHSETDLQSMAESNKTWLANSSETQIELSSLHGGIFVRFSIVLLVEGVQQLSELAKKVIIRKKSTIFVLS